MMHDRLVSRLRWVETESPFAHACPDLDQEYPDYTHAEAVRVREYTNRMYEAALSEARAYRAKLHPMTWYLDQLGDA